MRHSTFIVASTVAVVALLTGCGDGGGESPSIDPAEREAAEAWTADVCGSILDWQEAIGDLAQEGEPETRDEMVTFFRGALAATEQLVADLRAAGVPQVADGELVADTYLDGFRSARETTATALEQAEAISGEITTEQRQAILDVYGAGYQELSDTFAEAGERADAPALTEAFSNNADCAAVS